MHISIIVIATGRGIFPTVREADAKLVAEAIARDFPGDPGGEAWWIAEQPPAARVIDCVLSLRRSYDAVCLPRVKEFLSKFPAVRSCQDLADQIALDPKRFGPDVLRIDSPPLGERMLAVAQHLIDAQQRFEGKDELERLRGWAMWSRPGDYLALEIHRFGLAGFQYLRMLFGADTTKPDVHIIRYVSTVIGRPVSDVNALYILERAGQISGRSVRRLDNVIWERGARGR